MRRFHGSLLAVTIAPDWSSEAFQSTPTVCPLRNDQRSCQPSIGVEPVLVMVTWPRNPSCHWASLEYRTRQSPSSLCEARNDVTHASGAFQLMVSSLVDHDSMSSM